MYLRRSQSSAPWMRDAPLDVVSNAENRRLVTIVMDDAYTKLEPDIMKRAKQIARNAIDQLGPGRSGGGRIHVSRSRAELHGGSFAVRSGD